MPVTMTGAGGSSVAQGLTKLSFDVGGKTSDGVDIVEDNTNDIGGESKLEFNLREDSGSWKQRQKRRVRRLRNVCSRHPERNSFIESEMRR